MTRDLACPDCAQIDLVRRVTVVHAEESRITGTIGLGLNLATLSPVVGIGGSQTLSALGQALAPPMSPRAVVPQEPVQPTVRGPGASITLLNLVALVLTATGILGIVFNPRAGLLATAIGVTLGLFVRKRLRDHTVELAREKDQWEKDMVTYRGEKLRLELEHARQLEEWNRRMSVWRDTLYCGRCDRVFLEGDLDSCTPQNIAMLLNR